MSNLKLESKESLIQAIGSGQSYKYLFFWGHHPSRDGSITKSCFSQWWSSPFVVDGLTYPTAEHYMMAEKARLFDDRATAALIIQAEHPKQVKALGRQVLNFDEVLWQQKRSEIVIAGNYEKFTQNSALKRFLLQTGDRVLVEASPADPLWGIGLAEDHTDAGNPKQWPGLNLLGFALMAVRDRLQQES
jgi:ribA/ribD-fused uncharacterized protein